MTYTPKYKLTLNSNDGHQWYAIIASNTYSGALQERTLGASGMQLVKDSDTFFIGTSLQLSIEVKDDEVLGMLDLYSDDPRENLVSLYKVINGNDELQFTGYLQNEVYQDDYVAPPFDINVTAMDALGTLKNNHFALAGAQSEMAIVAHCLSYLDIPLPIAVSIDIFETRMSTSKTPLEQAYINSSVFINDNGEADDCYTVLSKILGSYGTPSEILLTQHKGYWYILRMVDYSNNFKVYNADGETLNTSIPPISIKALGSLSNGAPIYPIGNLTREIRAPYQKVSFNQAYGYTGNLIKYGDFSKLEDYELKWFNGLLELTNKYWKGDNGAIGSTSSYRKPGWMELRADNLGDAFPYWIKYTQYIEQTNSSISLRIDYQYIDWIANLGNGFKITLYCGGKYLGESGWQTDRHEFDIHLSDNAEQSLTIIADGIPSSGDLTVSFSQAYTKGLTVYQPRALFFKAAVLVDDAANIESKKHVVLLNEKNTKSPTYDFIGDAPNKPNATILYKKSKWLSDASLTEQWQQRGESGNYKLIDIVSRTLASNNRRGAQILSGIISGDFDLFGVIQHPLNDNRLFLPISGTFNIFENEFNVVLGELFPYEEIEYTYDDKEVLNNDNTATSVNAAKDYTVYGSGVGIGKRIHQLPLATHISGKYFIVDSGEQESAEKYPTTLLDLFEVVDDGNGSQYIRAKLSFASVGEITAYEAGGDIPSIWDNLPIGSKTNKGILQVGNGIDVVEGVISLDQSVITPQTLAFNNNILSISEGNSVDLSALDVDAYTRNESDNLFAAAVHNHDSVYSKLTHNHDTRYALKAGSGTQDFAANNLTVAGDLTIGGKINEVEVEHVKSENDLIITRHNATAGLIPGAYTGIQATKYDGANDGQLVFGSDGFARVGDVGDLQMLATRENTPVSNGIAYFDNTSKKFKTKTESSLSVGNSAKLNNISASQYVRNDVLAPSNFYQESLIFAYNSSSNIDHIWHDDSVNTFHMVSDGALKATGNSTLRIGQLNEGGTLLANKYLGINAMATDSDKLDGYHASSFPRKAEDAIVTAQWRFNNWVAIGKSSAPSEALDVNGNGRLSGNLTITDPLMSSSKSISLGSSYSTAIKAWRFSSVGQNKSAIGYNYNINSDGSWGKQSHWDNAAFIAFDSIITSNLRKGISFFVDHETDYIADVIRMFRMERDGKAWFGSYLAINKSTDATEALDVNGNGLFSGNITAQGEVTAFSASDKRLKTNIKALPSSLQIINKLSPVSFTWNATAMQLRSANNSNDVGLIAQELEEVLPDLVGTIYGKYKGVKYEKLIPYLIGAIKELSNKINT